jgi:hypothetical protein
VEKVALDAHAMFVGMPGLFWKFFTFDFGRRARDELLRVGVRAAAEAFFTDEVKALVTNLYGVEPSVSIVDIVQLVNNGATAGSQGAGVSLSEPSRRPAGHIGLPAETWGTSWTSRVSEGLDRRCRQRGTMVPQHVESR